ncbi:MAG: NAD(P)-binding domain-containing protein, partial [Halobacteriaceae archaeon]
MSDGTSGNVIGRVGVVGLGYVGLPLSLSLADAGYEVVGVDIDEDRVAQLQDGESYIRDVGNEWLAKHLKKRFVPTTKYERLSDADGISICVPTPLRKSGQPNIS